MTYDESKNKQLQLLRVCTGIQGLAYIVNDLEIILRNWVSKCLTHVWHSDSQFIPQLKQDLTLKRLVFPQLAFASASNIPLNTAESLLNSEIAWIKKTRENSRKSSGDCCADENMLEGHLTLCRELLAFMPAEKKYEVGSSNKANINLVKDLIEDFIFPASRY